MSRHFCNTTEGKGTVGKCSSMRHMQRTSTSYSIKGTKTIYITAQVSMITGS